MQKARPKNAQSPLAYTLRERKDGSKSIVLTLLGKRIASWISYRDLAEIESTIAKMQERFRTNQKLENNNSLFR